MTEAKPSPDLFLAACAALDVEPARCVALEDSANGVTAANAAGLCSVAVPNRLTAFLDLTHAHLVVPSLADVDLAKLEALVVARNPPPTVPAAGRRPGRPGSPQLPSQP